jgi:two-component system OmpR family response regulator
MGKIKVLVADDEKDILDVMVKKINLAGYDVVSAEDGEEAWEKIQRADPDIIVLDLNMPKMDGFSVLKNLREHPPQDKWQPVIIVSARTELADMQKGFSLEAEHYLTKPCHIDDVLKAIALMENLIPQRKSKLELASEDQTGSADSHKKSS